jgi:hypothetical protein
VINNRYGCRDSKQETTVTDDLIDEDQLKKRSGNLAEFFAAAPLREGGIEIVRLKDGARDSSLSLLGDDHCDAGWSAKEMDAS